MGQHSPTLVNRIEGGGGSVPRGGVLGFRGEGEKWEKGWEVGFLGFGGKRKRDGGGVVL
jgi:hypothetical protein